MSDLPLKLVCCAGLIALLIGCSNSRPATVAVAPTPEIKPAVTSPPAQPPKMSLTEQRLHATGAELDRLVADPKFGIPDAVLNRTACLAVFPANDRANRLPEGFVSCRNTAQQWTSPAVADLSVRADARPASDLYLFVLSERARKQLVNGELDLRAGLKTAPGLTDADAAIVDQVTASADVFAYAADSKLLRGVRAPEGVVTIQPGKTARLYGHPLETAWLLNGSTLSSSVTSFYQIEVASFFNTITPMGIIVHHTVLTPGGNAPEAERALDEFHDARGFEASCFGKVYHIAYHYLILPDGKVISGRPERCEGAHARGYNSYLGIALVGNFSARGKSGSCAHPTHAQFASLVKLCSRLRQKYRIPLQRIMPHDQVAKTECPGEGVKFGELLAAINREPGAGS